MASNLSLGSGAVGHRAFAGSPDARGRSFEPGHQGPYPGGYPAPPQEAAASGAGLPVAFRHPGLGLLRHPSPAEDFSSPHGRPTRPHWPGPQRGCHVPQAQDAIGVGLSSIPGRRCPPGRQGLTVRRLPLPSGQPFTLATQPACEGGSDETSTEIHAIDPSDLSLARASRTEREASGVSLGFTPRRYQRRMPGREQVSRTLTRSYTFDISLTSNS